MAVSAMKRLRRRRTSSSATYRAPDSASSARSRISAIRTWLLPAIQSAILDNASRYVRRGGTLVYSTCTVLPEENERVTDAFLRAHLDFTYDTFALPGPIGTVEGHITLWPQRHGTDGFYICRMTRKE